MFRFLFTEGQEGKMAAVVAALQFGKDYNIFKLFGAAHYTVRKIIHISKTVVSPPGGGVPCSS